VATQDTLTHFGQFETRAGWKNGKTSYIARGSSRLEQKHTSRGAAISAGVHKAIEESAFLMIYERDAGAPIERRAVDLPGLVH
jgi:hypothetical protein